MKKASLIICMILSIFILGSVVYVEAKEDNSDLTFTDPQTGLVWSRNGNIAGEGMTLLKALYWVGNLSYAGYSDWRLPTIEELRFMAKRGGKEPSKWLNANGFNNVQAGSYLSSTKHTPGFEPLVWVEYMDVSGMSLARIDYGDYYVWPVRRGKADYKWESCLKYSGYADGCNQCSDGGTLPSAGKAKIGIYENIINDSEDTLIVFLDDYKYTVQSFNGDSIIVSNNLFNFSSNLQTGTSNSGRPYAYFLPKSRTNILEAKAGHGIELKATSNNLHHIAARLTHHYTFAKYSNGKLASATYTYNSCVFYYAGKNQH